MGLLEDAIREHLELKRKHGASEEEIRRKAAEAFGPLGGVSSAEQGAVSLPEREAPSLPPEPPAAASSGVQPSPADRERRDEFAPEGVAPPSEGPPEPLAEGSPAPQPDPPASGSPAVLDEHPTLLIDEDWFEPPGHQAPPPPAEQASPADSAAEAVAADQMPADPEVSPDPLDETPDFLRDTPEHDRLWFEHGPPRDFDFD